jgi:hypothetical protein
VNVAKGPVYYDELMERTYIVYYDVEKAESMFIVYDEYRDPVFTFPRMSRAQRKALEASLRKELELVRQHFEKLYGEAEAEGKDGWEMHQAIRDQARADGVPDYDLEQALLDLEKVDTPVERMSEFLLVSGLVSWFGLLVIGALLKVAGVISPNSGWAGGYVLGVVAILGGAWLVSLIPDRWG